MYSPKDEFKWQKVKLHKLHFVMLVLTGTHTEKCQNSEYCDWSVSIKGSNNYTVH